MSLKSGECVRSPSELAGVIAGLEANDATSRSVQGMWVSWLSEYGTPGFYDRKGTGYDARYAYNHVQNPEALLWLAQAAGVEVHVISMAREEIRDKTNLSAQAAAVRKHVPWPAIASLLWPTG